MLLSPMMSIFAGDTAGQKVYYEAELSPPCAIVVGGEVRGLSPGLRSDIQRGAATSVRYIIICSFANHFCILSLQHT